MIKLNIYLHQLKDSSNIWGLYMSPISFKIVIKMHEKVGQSSEENKEIIKELIGKLKETGVNID